MRAVATDGNIILFRAQRIRTIFRKTQVHSYCCSHFRPQNLTFANPIKQHNIGGLHLNKESLRHTHYNKPRTQAALVLVPESEREEFPAT